MNNSDLAEGLRMQRARVGESQRELAEAIGVNPSTVSSWENRGGIGLADAWKIADHYQITLDELAGRDFSGSAVLA